MSSSEQNIVQFFNAVDMLGNQLLCRHLNILHERNHSLQAAYSFSYSAYFQRKTLEELQALLSSDILNCQVTMIVLNWGPNCLKCQHFHKKIYCLFFWTRRRFLIAHDKLFEGVSQNQSTHRSRQPSTMSGRSASKPESPNVQLPVNKKLTQKSRVWHLKLIAANV